MMLGPRMDLGTSKSLFVGLIRVKAADTFDWCLASVTPYRASLGLELGLARPVFQRIAQSCFDAHSRLT